MSSGLVLLGALTLLLPSATAEPSVSFPFNSQLPPVARISEPFSYTLSSQTFTSDSNLTYSLRDAPDWLSIDQDSGRLSGTPEEDEVPEGEVVGIPVDIVAEDDSGSTSMSATLVVSRNEAPTINIPLSEQIEDFGDRSAPDAIISYPDSTFSFTFDEDTFSSQVPLDYYATSADSSPLPSWITFNADDLTFSGQTPPFESLVQPPQTFDFNLVASDVEGFSASTIVFSVVVGSRKLTIDNPVVELNTTRGESVSYDGLADDIRLDDESVDPSELDIATDGLPEWLSLDEDTLEISGTPPDDAQSVNATIVFQTSLSDRLNVQLQVAVATNIFRRTLSSVDATLGEPFNLDLESYFWNPEDVNVEIETSPNQDWLELDGLVLSGTPPESADSNDDVQLTIQATTNGGDSETEEVTLRVLSATDATSSTRAPTPSPTTTSTPSGSPSESHGADAQSDSFGEGLNAAQIALAVLAPIVVIALLVLLFICLRRRRARKFNKVERRDISGPVPGTLVQNGSMHSDDPDVVETVKHYNAIPPPQPTYRPGQKGYMGAALKRIRSTRTTSSFDSDESFRSADLAPPQLPQLRSVSDNALTESRNSWLTEEGFVESAERGRGSQRVSRNSILSLYDSMRNFPSRQRFMRGQTEGSFRDTLDVTIPSMEEDRHSFQPPPEPVYMLNKPAFNQHASEKPGTRTKNAKPDFLVPMPSPAAASSEALASIPEQFSPLGSHPTYGSRHPPPGAGGIFKVYSDSSGRESRDTFDTVSRIGSGTGSGSNDEALTRLQSRGSDVSYARPVSRRSDASPWFGGGAAIQPRHQRSRSQLPRPQHGASGGDFDGESWSAGDGFSSLGSESNWRVISRDSSTMFPGPRGTANWQTAGSESVNIPYEESSAFYPRSSVAPPRLPPKSRKRASTVASSAASSWRYGGQENVTPVASRHDKSWMGKGVSLRPRPLTHTHRRSESSVSLMSPSKWDAARASTGTRTSTREPLAERPISTVRPSRQNAPNQPHQPGLLGLKFGSGSMSGSGGFGGSSGTGLLFGGAENAARHNGSGGSDESDWVTEPGTLGRDDDSSSTRRRRGSVFMGSRENSARSRGRLGGRVSEDDFAVYI